MTGQTNDILMKTLKQLLIQCLLYSFILLIVGCSRSAGTLSGKSNTQQTATSASAINEKETKPQSNTDAAKETISSTPSPVPNQINANSGLLLGLRTDIELRESSYRTIWIAQSGTEVKLIAQGQSIIVPFGQEWWQVEAKQYKDSKKSSYSNDLNTVIINDLISHPAGKSYSNEQSIRSYSQNLLERWLSAQECPKINFVSDKYISVSSDYYYNSGGTFRPYINDTYITAIGDLNRSYEYTSMEKDLIPSSKDLSNIKKVSITSIFGNEVLPYIDRFAKESISEKEQALYGSSPKVDNKTDENGWAISRRNGKWVLQIAKKWTFQNGSTVASTCSLNEIPISLPKTFVSYDDLNPDWDTIKKAVPEATDAVSSPSKDMLVVFTPENLLIYTYPLNGIMKPVLTVKLNKNESMIMAQWATGDYVDKWTLEVSKYLK